MGVLAPLLSSKPKVPKFKPLDFGKETATSLAEYQANLPAAAEFASKFNELSGDQMLAALEKMLPGYAKLRDTGTSLIQSQMRGEVPQDVQNRLERQAAERGVTIGGAGSGLAGNDYLRNFGLTSLQLTQQGLNSAAQWMNQAASKTPVFNMSNAFIPIQQRIGIRQQENESQWQRNWLKNQISAVPDGWQGALIGLEDNIGAILGAAASNYNWGGTGAGGGGATGPAKADSGGGGL